MFFVYFIFNFSNQNMLPLGFLCRSTLKQCTETCLLQARFELCNTIWEDKAEKSIPLLMCNLWKLYVSGLGFFYPSHRYKNRKLKPFKIILQVETFFILMNLIVFSFWFLSQSAINEYFPAFLEKLLYRIKIAEFQ